MEFGIHVKTYDQVTAKEGDVTKPKWVPGGEIVIGPHVRMGRGKYGRVSICCVAHNFTSWSNFSFSRYGKKPDLG